MRYEIAENDSGECRVTPLDGSQANITWQLVFTTMEHARDAVLTVSRFGKRIPPTEAGKCDRCGMATDNEVTSEQQ